MIDLVETHVCVPRLPLISNYGSANDVKEIFEKLNLCCSKFDRLRAIGDALLRSSDETMSSSSPHKQLLRQSGHPYFLEQNIFVLWLLQRKKASGLSNIDLLKVGWASDTFIQFWSQLQIVLVLNITKPFNALTGD